MARSYLRGLAALLLFAFAAAPVNAQPYSWDPGITAGAALGGDGTWQTGTGNWFDGTANANAPWIGGFVANFGGTAGIVAVEAGGVSATGLTFLTTGYSLGGTGVITLTTPTITIGGGLTATISAPIGGSAGLTVAGGGALTLSGTNTYSGTVSITGGSTLTITNNANLGAATNTVLINGGTLSGGGINLTAWSSTRNVTIGTLGATLLNTTAAEFRINGLITDGAGTPGLVTMQATGTANIVIDNGLGTSGVNLNTYAGGTIILPGGAGGVIPIQSSTGTPGVPTSGPFGTGIIDLAGGNFRPTSVGPVTLHNNFRFSADVVIPAGGNTLTILGNASLPNGSRTFTNSTTVTIDGVISEVVPASAFTKLGTGSLFLGGVNTYSGPVTITAGLLSLGNLANGGVPSALGTSTSAATNLILNGGTFGYSGSVAASTDRNYTVTGAAFGFDASGTLPAATLTISGVPSYTNTFATRTLTLTGANTGANTFSANLADAGVGDVLAITKTGAGSWTLSGTNTHTGATLVSAGTLNLAGSVVGSNITVNGATAALIQPSTGVIGTATSTFTLTSGIATLAGTNTHSGLNTLTAGTLNIQSAGALGTGPITLVATTLDNTGAGPITLSNTSAIAHNGNFAFTGTNSLTITGPLTAGGGRTITLNSTNGSVLNLGTITNTNANSNVHTYNGPGNLITFAGIVLSTSTNTRTHTIAGTANVNILGTVTNGAAPNHILAITSTGTVNLNGVVSNTGSLTINNTTGTANLNADRTGVITLTSGLLNVTVGISNTAATAINGGTLALVNGGNLTGATVVTVGAGTLAVRPGIPAAINSMAGNLVLNAGSNLSMADGTTSVFNIAGTGILAPATGVSPVIGLNLGGVTTVADRINITGAATVGAAGTLINIIPAGTTAPSIGSYTLITAASGLGSNVRLASNKVVFNGVAYETTLTNSAGSSVVNVTGLTGVDAAYWTGAQGSTWNAVSGPNTNWNTTESGGSNTGAQPTYLTDVFFATTVPSAANLANTLGANYTINSLNFTAASGSAIIGGTNTLTLIGGNLAGNGITVAASSPVQTLNLPLVLGASHNWSNNSSNALAVNGTLATAGFTVSLTGTGDFNLAGAITGTGGLAMLSPGLLTLGSAGNTYSGGTSIGASTVTVNTGAKLGSGFVAFTGSTGTLNLGTTAQSITNLSFPTAGTGTFTITGTSLTLTPTAAVQVHAGSGVTRTLDLTGLATFTSNGPAANFTVGGSDSAGGSIGNGILLLGPTSTITAAAVTVGMTGSSSSGIVNTGTIQLGQNTTINANTITLAANKTSATIGYPAITAPTLTIRGSTGGNSTANVNIAGNHSSTNFGSTGMFDLVTGVTGGSTLDAKIGTLQIAVTSFAGVTSSVGASGTFRMGGGTMEATAIVLGVSGGTGYATSPISATLSLDGGTIAVTTLTLADFPVVTLPTSSATFTLNSGTLRATTITRGSSAGTVGVINFTWVDGTIGNIAGSNQTVVGALPTQTGTLTIDLNNTGNISGTHAWNVGTGFTSNVANTVLLSGTGSLTKTGLGALILNGATSHAGSTTVAEGQLVVGTGNLAGTSGVTVLTGASLGNLPSTPTTLTIPTLAINGNTVMNISYAGGAVSTIASSGIATATGTVSIGLSGASITTGTYNLITGGAGSTLNSATYTILNPVNFTFTTTVSDTAVQLNATSVPTPLASALWIGGLPGALGVWGASNGGTNSNWLDSSGTPVATPLVPGSTANVTFSATGATNQTGMTLGTNMAINSLIQNSGSAISLDTGIYLLTIGSSATPGITVTSGATTINGNLALGIAQTWANNDAVSALNIGANVANNGFLLTVGGSGATTISGVINGTAGLTKIGAATLALSGASIYSGTTTLLDGIIVTAVNNALPAAPLVIGSTAGTAGTLNLGTNNQTLTTLTLNSSSTTSQIIVGSGSVLTVTGNITIGPAPAATTTTRLTITGGGSFVVNSANATLGVGGATSTIGENATFDLTGLNSTNINLGSGTLRVNNNTGSNVATNIATMLLPTPTAGITPTTPVTTITAATLAVGNNGSNGAGANQTNSLVLGTGLTQLNINTVSIATGSRDIGQIVYAAGNGTLILRASNGTGRSAVSVGGSGGGTGVGRGTGVNGILFDVNGHYSDLLIGTLAVGNQHRTNTNMNYDFKFDTGILDATTVNVGFATTANSNAATVANTLTSTITIGGGLANIGTGGLNLGTTADITPVPAFAKLIVGEVLISGGVVNIGTTGAYSVRLGNVVGTTNTNVSVTSTLNITGGTVTLAGPIVSASQGTRTSANLILNGGLLDLAGSTIGGGTTPTNLTTITLASGTLQNVAQINGGAAITKTTAGTLILSGINAYSGSTTVNAGTLNVNGSHTSTTAGFTVQTTGTLGGTGSIVSTATVESGGTIRGGDSVSTTGTLSTAGVNIAGGGNLSANLGASGTSSRLNIGANTLNWSTIGSNPFLKLASIVAFDNTQNASWIIAQGSVGAGYTVDGIAQTNFGSYLHGTGPSGSVTIDPGVISLNAGDRFDLVRYNNNLVLDFTSAAVPEPGTILGLSMAGLGFARWLRRRRMS